MQRLVQSERELRRALEDTLGTRHPAKPKHAIGADVDEFLASTDWNEEGLSKMWRQRWREDREAERAGR